MLSDITNFSDPISIMIIFDKPRRINSIGIGNTDGTTFTINGQTIYFSRNGLYLFNEITAGNITINHNATRIGRIAAGMAVDIPTSITKEPAFCSTAEPRTTLSGQVIPGAGGYNYRTLSLDSRYKIGKAAISEIDEGYKYIGMGYPFFLDLSDEAYKLPFSKLYATEANQRKMGFESGARKFLYSKRFEFRECF
jgi:hypothetical protein